MAEIREILNDLDEQRTCMYEVGDDACGDVITDAIQVIEELQNQIPKWHLVSDGDLPKDDTAVIAYIKREITDVFMMVNISSISGKWQMWESDRDLYDDEEVIAWCELPKFEEVE